MRGVRLLDARPPPQRLTRFGTRPRPTSITCAPGSTRPRWDSIHRGAEAGQGQPLDAAPSVDCEILRRLDADRVFRRAARRSRERDRRLGSIGGAIRRHPKSLRPWARSRERGLLARAVFALHPGQLTGDHRPASSPVVAGPPSAPEDGSPGVVTSVATSIGYILPSIVDRDG